MMKTLTIIFLLLINYHAAKKYLVEVGDSKGSDYRVPPMFTINMFPTLATKSTPRPRYVCTSLNCLEVWVRGAGPSDGRYRPVGRENKRTVFRRSTGRTVIKYEGTGWTIGSDYTSKPGQSLSPHTALERHCRQQCEPGLWPLPGGLGRGREGDLHQEGQGSQAVLLEEQEGQ